MKIQGYSNPAGNLMMVPQIIKPPSITGIIKRGLPNKDLPPFVNKWRKGNLVRLFTGAYRIWISEKLEIPFAYGALYLTIIKPVLDTTELRKQYVDLNPGMNFVDWARSQGALFRFMPLGLAGTRVVTDVGVGYIVDGFQNSTELENMKYHALGTGATAEAANETALVTELTTEYTGNVRATGTTTEGASANIYRTVGTNTLDGTPGAALREHGILSQAATGGGVLLDRTLYAAITLSSGDALQSTYDLTLTAGS